MIPLSVRVIMYGFDANVPKGGFPTQGYKTIMDEVERIRNTDTLFPEGTDTQVERYFYWSQKTRWAFKRLLLFWNEHRFKNQYGNEDDLYGDSFSDYEDNIPILTLWDWRSRRYYRFGYNELIEHGYSKLRSHAYPTNPYINMPFTLSQCIVIKTFLDDHTNVDVPCDKRNIVHKYTRFPKDMFLNTQNLMGQNGFMMFQDSIESGPRSVAEEILFEDIIDGTGQIKEDKKSLSKGMKEILFKLIVNERNDLIYIPNTKCERHLFQIYIKYGLRETLDFYKNWLNKNRKRFRVQNHKRRGPFYNMVMHRVKI